LGRNQPKNGYRQIKRDEIMKQRTIDIFVGLFVVLGLVSFLFLALKAANLNSLTRDAGYMVSARFDNIGGLKPRAPVKSAGVVVGRVDSIEFDTKTYQATVVLQLENKYQFPKDSSVKILTAGLLGEQYIGIEPGGDSVMLNQGAVITMTQSAVVLENLISQFLYNKAADSSTTQTK
jgi:phospholipid/cholesterol/gamma-HCH transport system substrate-binding protein